MKNIAIFASGSGTNAENIYRFFQNGNRVNVKLVIYDRKNAGVAERMSKYPDVRIIYLPRDTWKENPSEIVNLLKAEQIDLIVLAGFLRVIPAELTSAYAGRMINIHPSLLPAYGGMGMFGLKVHEAVIANGEKRSGVTVHYVSDEVDGGEILMQESLEVLPDDTPESLQSRIHEIEYTIFPKAIIEALARLENPELPEVATDESALQEETDVEVVEVNESSAPVSYESMTPPSIAGITPPPPPAQEWAESLGIQYNPDKIPDSPFNGSPEGAYAGNPQENPQPAWNPQQRPEWNPQQRPDGYSQPGQGQYPEPKVQPQEKKEEAKCPKSYMGWAIVFTLLCCLPTGIVAIIYASQVTSKFHTGDIDGAYRASDRAQLWIIISFVLGLVANVLSIPFMFVN